MFRPKVLYGVICLDRGDPNIYVVGKQYNFMGVNIKIKAGGNHFPLNTVVLKVAWVDNVKVCC